MVNRFFEQPILNPPYEYPAKHWELDDQGQPTQQVIENRRGAEFITPIPKPRKRKAAKSQQQFVFDEGKGLSTQEQLRGDGTGDRQEVSHLRGRDPLLLPYARAKDGQVRHRRLQPQRPVRQAVLAEGG